MSLKKNLTANFSGSAWMALMSIVFVPFYLELMGPEAYGIVGIYASLVGMLTILDFGLSQTMNREMARLSHDVINEQKVNDTARTLEIIYWFIAVFVGLIVFFLAKPIALYWLNPDQLSFQDIQLAIQIIGAVIALRWPVSFYMGGLNGLERQVIVNIILAIVATIQGVGALVVLNLIEPTIKVFFIWQASMALVQVVALKAALSKSLPSSSKGHWDKHLLAGIWRFSAGVSGISLFATILTQLDKVILSRVLSLTDFGYYTFATTVAAVTFRLVGPVFTAYYPRLTQFVSKAEHDSLVKTYHQGSQVMAVVLLPIAIVLVVFSEQILMLWTNNQSLVTNTSMLVSLIIVGNTLNGIMHLPYALQLAHGWTTLALSQNILAVILLAPAIYFSSVRWGAVGAASCWIVLNASYLLIGNHVMHRRLLKTEKWKWYINDLLKPLVIVVVVCIFARSLLHDQVRSEFTVLIVSMAFITSSTLALICSSRLRRFALNYMKGTLAK